MVIYCGENDFAGSDTVTAQLVFARFKQLFSIIRDQYPKVKITYISMKPSPSRSSAYAQNAGGKPFDQKLFKEEKENIVC